MFSQCKITGAISTIPSTPGLLVWNSGHIGISLDGIWAIEARNFEDGIVKTRIKDRKWTKWGQLPANMLDYVNGSVNSVQPTLETNCPYPEPTVNLKRRVECEGVKWIQWMLEKCGYSVGECGIDGIFGSDTRAAVRSFQRDRALEVDAIVGPLTRNALKVRLEELKHD